MHALGGGRPGLRRHRDRHPGALQPHRPHRPLRPGPPRRRDQPRRVRGRRPRPAGRGRRRHPARRRRRTAQGLLAAEAEQVNAAWLTSVRRGRPHVTWKYAATLDGRTAAADGTSRWITSAEARADVHRLRAEADAILVGAGTARADDPHLAARLPAPAPDAPAPVQPLRIVLDSDATAVRPGARVLDEAAPTLVAVAEDADARHLEGHPHAEVLRLPRTDGGLDLPALLAVLHARSVRSVLLEGGARLAGAFVAAGAVDRVVGYLAPALLGAGPQVLTGGGISTIAEALRLDITDARRIGPDLRITAAPATPLTKEH
ncbi:bifunctional diaminohydroxyphosphoribosylaminopyrimidine deaminase/5-amino-6-(5-phosphoribosylamino)uracil reductase RibD [Streptomyces albidoflavus]